MGFKAVCRVSVVLSLCVVYAHVCFMELWHYHERPVTTVCYGIMALLSCALSIICIDIIHQNPADSFTWRTMLDHYGWYTYLIVRGWWLFGWLEKRSADITSLLEDNLSNIIDQNKSTGFGKDRGFDKIKNSADFRKNIPFGSYDTMKDYIARVKDGDYKAFTNDPVIYVVYTSGTTGNRKYWPLTKSTPLIEAKALKEYNVYRRVGRSMGRTLMLFHTYNQPNYEPNKPTVQTLSSIAFGHRPFWTNPTEVFTIVKEPSFLYASAVFALRDRELDSIKTGFSFMMFSFWIIVSNNWQQMCDNIENGCIDRGTIEVDEEKLVKINSYLTPDPKRAEELRKEFRKGMHKIARRVWPRLLYIDMVCTGALAHPAKLMQANQLYGIPYFSLHVSSSETLMGYNTDADLDSYKYTLFPVRQYFEFIPEIAVSEANPETIETAELKVGESYELVATTHCGLTRYRTGDILKCVDKFKQLPVFVFSYRNGQLLDLAGEKITERTFYDSLLRTCEELNVQLINYTSTGNRNMSDIKAYLEKFEDPNLASPHYLLFCEILKEGKRVSLSEEEKTKFDEDLRRHYDLYNQMRKEGQIGRMEVLETKQNTFEALKTLMIRDTQNDQFKMPRVVSNRVFLEFLMAQLSTN